MIMPINKEPQPEQPQQPNGSIQNLINHDLQASILAEAVRHCIGVMVLDPLAYQLEEYIKSVDAQWTTIRNKIDPILEGKFSQCPHCGSTILAGPFCEGSKFICPTCGLDSYWKLLENKGLEIGVKYILEKEQSHAE
jgi:predicted RNA-binding Zn-ribbon protein involved in translation (DUF1610 family)